MTTDTTIAPPDDPALAAWDAIEWDAMPERVRLQVMRAQVEEARLFAQTIHDQVALIGKLFTAARGRA